MPTESQASISFGPGPAQNIDEYPMTRYESLLQELPQAPKT